MVSETKITLLAQKHKFMMDEKYMHRAIDLALRAETHSISPNPRVGAVLVHGDRVIGEGYHVRVGEGHAEVNCLASVREEHLHLIPESTMYVTLEPCAHEGRTPSCARRLVRERVKRVVVGTLDPFPLVSGMGIEILREGGVEVIAPFMEKECRELAGVFLVGQRLHRPYITLKWAETADGFIDRIRTSPEEMPLHLSSPFTRLLVHRERSMNMGILVGRRTYELDRPQLTNRLWTLSPATPRPFLLSSVRPDKMREGWGYVRGVCCAEMERLLVEEGITSLLVEGGADTLRAFMEEGLWDEIRREVAPIRIREGVSAPRIPDDAEERSRGIIDGRLLLRYARVSPSPCGSATQAADPE